MQFLGCISIRNRMGLNQLHSIVSNSVVVVIHMQYVAEVR